MLSIAERGMLMEIAQTISSLFCLPASRRRKESDPYQPNTY